MVENKIKSIYAVEAYIPNDENIVSWTIFKLQSIGVRTTKKFGWISINGKIQEGLATSTDSWGRDTEIEALLNFVQFMNMEFIKITTDGFDAAITLKNQMVEDLKNELSKE